MRVTGTPDGAAVAAAVSEIDYQYVLLCAVGDARYPVSGRRLAAALVACGYRGALARHLVATTPLLAGAGVRAFRLSSGRPEPAPA